MPAFEKEEYEIRWWFDWRNCVGTSSISTNISEGCGREGGRDFARFLQIAMGSATEVEYLILLCKDIQLLSPQIYEDLKIETTQIKKMLASFIKKLRSEN